MDVGRLLEEFVRLADGDPEEFRSFVSKYGPLPLCARHLAPIEGPGSLQGHYNHDNSPPQPCTAFALQHPLDVYQLMAQRVRATLALARALHAYEDQVVARQWAPICRDHLVDEQLRILNAEPHPGRHVKRHRRDPSAHVRSVVQAEVNAWVGCSQTRLRFRWAANGVGVTEIEDPRPSDTWAFTCNVVLWDRIARQLAAAVSRRQGAANLPRKCKACDEPAEPQNGRGRPPEYCAEHRAIRSTLNKRHQRKRKA